MFQTPTFFVHGDKIDKSSNMNEHATECPLFFLKKFYPKPIFKLRYVQLHAIYIYIISVCNEFNILCQTNPLHKENITNFSIFFFKIMHTHILEFLNLSLGLGLG